MRVSVREDASSYCLMLCVRVRVSVREEATRNMRGIISHSSSNISSDTPCTQGVKSLVYTGINDSYTHKGLNNSFTDGKMTHTHTRG